MHDDFGNYNEMSDIPSQPNINMINSQLISNDSKTKVDSYSTFNKDTNSSNNS